MEYKVIGSVMPVVELTLAGGEEIYAQPGSMSWMDEGITMETNTGGLFKGLKRSLMGEKMFLVYFSATREGAQVSFGHSFPGHIIPVDVARQSIICQKRAFLCAQKGVELDIAFQRRLGAGLFGGEGFIMQRLSGQGTAFIEIDGECVVRDLDVGETIHVETGNVATYEESVNMDIQMVKGLKNIFFGGEGLFMTTLRGPGRVWLQTMPLQNLARDLIPFMPKPSSK
ncbi:MAG: TIGR00266 family protein [Firmicutes bacterium]|nr:TIGR00266 family protein [Bacillota bacterium]